MKKKKIRKKITSMLLAFAMFISLFGGYSIKAEAAEPIVLQGTEFTTSPGEGFTFDAYFYCRTCKKDIYEDSNIDGHSFKITSFTYTISGGTFSWNASAEFKGCGGEGTGENSYSNSYVCDEKTDKFLSANCKVLNEIVGAFLIEITREKSAHRGNATCRTADNCVLCNKSYTNSSNHEQPNDFICSVSTSDNTKHDKKYACCGATAETVSHTTEPTYTVNSEDSIKHDKQYDCCEGIAETTEHSNYTYSKPAENIITAKCADCRYETNLTLSAPANLTYDGAGKAATIEGNIVNVATPTITYTRGGTPLDGIPVDVGTYTASIAIDGVTASVNYEIVKADMQLEVSGYTGTYDGNAHGITVSAPENARVEYKYGADGVWSETNPTFTNAGTYTVDYKVTKENYNDVTGTATVTINPADMEVTVDNYNGVYDEEAHGITVTAPEDATVEYRLSETENWSTTNPTFTEPTETPVTVYYRVMKENHNAVTGSATVTIAKANAQITVGTSSYTKTYGDGTFTLDVSDNNPEVDIVYTITNSKDVYGNIVNDNAVIVVENGTVTIKGAGTATISVSLPESTHYNAAQSRSIVVDARPASYTVPTIYKNYLYSRENADSIDVAALLPDDCGTVTYEISGGENFYTVNPSVSDGKLSYTVANGTVGSTDTIDVIAKTQNYGGIIIKVEISLIDQLPVSVEEGESVSLNNNTLTYGEALSKLTFKTVTFVDNDGNVVEGSLTWKDEALKPNAGTTSATWVFTPSDETYAVLEDTVAITVNKAVPEVTAVPTVADGTYHPTVALADNDLTGGTVKGVDVNTLAGTWSWQTQSVVPIVNNSGYIAVFTPDDSTNYEQITRTITVTVDKAIPVIKQIAVSDITYGDTLADSSISGAAQFSVSEYVTVAGSFAWKDSTVKPTVADSDTTAYAVIFTPADTINYNAVETTVTLTVNKAENAPNMPGTSMSVSNKYTKVGDVPLPTGWEWRDTDKETALVVDTPVTATAVYTGADKGNYENEAVSVSVTRNACDHEAGDVLYTGEGEKAPTCTESGLGHKECKKCNTVMESGIVVNGLGHTGGTATCKDKAVCTRCKQPYGSTDGSKHGDTEVRGYRAATCTSGGYTGDTHCKDCGAKLSSGTSTGANGHNYTGVVTTEPTTEEAGIRTYTCLTCHDSYTEVIPKLPKEEHKHVYTGSVAKEATCTQTGTRTYTCTCGDSYIETIPMTKHNYSSEVTTEPTADKEGVMTYTCLECGHIYTDSIERTGNGGIDGNNTEAEAPFIKDEEGKEGWDVILDDVEDTEEGSTVTVDMNGSTVVPGDVFDDIKGKDITMVFDMGNGITWSVNGKDITSDNVGDINFSVKVGADANNTIPVEILNKVSGERYSMNISLAYDGEFGFKATLAMNVDAKNAGLFANLFYFNEQTGELEFICADEIAEDGTAELTFTHASEYTVVIDKVAMGTVTAPDTSDTTPVSNSLEFGSDDDGGAWWILLLVAILAAAGVAGYVVYSKKKKSE